MTEKSISVLVSSFPYFKLLTALYLDDNEFGTDGAKSIAKNLKFLSKLKTLSCCTCEITAGGAYFLAKTASAIPSFINLELDGNAIIEEGVNTIQSTLLEKKKILGGYL